MKILSVMLAGSHMYGTNRPDSDIDLRGVCFPEKYNLFGLQGFVQWMPAKEEGLKWSESRYGLKSDDITIYGLHKFCKLAADSNPNIIEMLFANTLEETAEWRTIKANRSLFVSQKAIHTFSGYAHAQLKRIEGHRKWLLDPPTKPDPHEYGMAWGDKGQPVWESLNKKNAYDNLLKNYQAYTTWRENRNPRRAKLEEKHGYDSKHAMHLFRLYFEAKELLEWGTITLPLPSHTKDILMYVLNGGISYEELLSQSKLMDDELHSKDFPVPKKPNRKEVDKMVINLTKNYVCS